VQKTDWREGDDARSSESGGSAFVRTVGISSADAVKVGATLELLSLGAAVSEAGVGLAAETRQQETFERSS
jgi:hypothetical protein